MGFGSAKRLQGLPAPWDVYLVTAHDGHAIETMQVEERRYKPSPEFSRQANAQPDIYNRTTSFCKSEKVICLRSPSGSPSQK